jgi:hypothetical protein
MIIVRFADGYVAGFQFREDAERFPADLRDRFAPFSLELHPDMTRLIEFGWSAARDRASRGDPRRETFDFLASRNNAPKTGSDASYCDASRASGRCGPSFTRSRPRRGDAGTTRSPNRAPAWPAAWTGTTVIRGARQQAEHGRRFASRSPSDGTRRYGAAASTPDDLGADVPRRAPMAAFNPPSTIPSHSNALMPKPKAGAQCVRAHAGICVGRSATAVPTAIPSVRPTQRARCLWSMGTTLVDRPGEG